MEIDLQRLLDKGIIIPSEHETCEFIFIIFVRPKADGSFRLIFNLKRLNEHVVYHHFKVESLKSVIELVEKACFMAPMDLRDAYHSVPISVHAHKYLKFTYPSMPINTSSSHREENCSNLLACQMVCAVHIDCSQIC